MSAGARSTRRLTDTARWSAALVLALCFHAAGAVALLAHWSDDSDTVANAPVVTVELAPLPVAPQTTPTELPPDVVQSADAQPEPTPEKPVEKIELPVEPQAELQITPPPPPVAKPKDKKPKQKQASLASAPSAAEQKAARAAAPAQGASSHNPNALPNWKSQLVSRLERYKRYPSEAQSRGDHGVAQIAFSVDRSGGVHHARILRSSGSSVLDAATLALVERAAPMPPPPPEISGAQIAIVVPIRYNIR
jgi:protein TonB